MLYVRVPAGGTDECEGNKLVPEGIILRHGLCAHQGLEALVVGQITDLARVGAHLCSLLSNRHATLHSVFTGHMTSPVGQKMLNCEGEITLLHTRQLKTSEKKTLHYILSIRLNISKVNDFSKL